MLLKIKHKSRNNERIVDENVYNELREKGHLEGYKIVEKIPERKITADVKGEIPKDISERIVKKKIESSEIEIK